MDAVFECSKGKAKREEDEATTSHGRMKKKKNKPRRENELIAAAERSEKKGGKPLTDYFEKILDGPCPNHVFLAKNLYKDSFLMKYL